MKKTIYTLNIDNYAPQITALTYPLIQRYADKIGANFEIIGTRQFPGWPVVYEKLQIHELGKDNDWNIYIDSDAIVHPDMFDVTDHLTKDTVLHNGRDMAGNRWSYDRFFRRDGRHIGSCNWFTVASDWCIDLWKPLDDLTFEEAVKNIHPVMSEAATGLIAPSHLIDDYTVSRNIAKFGLKFDTLIEMQARRKDQGAYLFHLYNIPESAKLEQMSNYLLSKGLMRFSPSYV
jgi:hypothetical protein